VSQRQRRTRGRTLAAVKSLLSFGAKLGALRFNVGAALLAPKSRNELAERILDEADVAKMLVLTEGRNHAFVRLAYASGLRVSELVGLAVGRSRRRRGRDAVRRRVRERREDADRAGFRRDGERDARPARRGAAEHVRFCGVEWGVHPAQAWRIVRGVDEIATPTRGRKSRPASRLPFSIAVRYSYTYSAVARKRGCMGFSFGEDFLFFDEN